MTFELLDDIYFPERIKKGYKGLPQVSSQLNIGGRNKHDNYQTPYRMTHRLFQKELFNGNVLEPSCGQGAIVQILERQHFTKVYSYDKYLTNIKIDFLEEKRVLFQNMITNPPFSKAAEFIWHAKKIIQDKFALLLPLDYVHGKERFEKLWSVEDEFSLSRIHVFVRRPLLKNTIRPDGRYETGQLTYAWFVWEKGPWKLPEISWINNQEDIV